MHYKLNTYVNELDDCSVAVPKSPDGAKSDHWGDEVHSTNENGT